jgi:FMN phosphatase YigB (HAD superfamily)
MFTAHTKSRINRKLPIILCDYRDTCNDIKKHNPLLDKLSEYQQEGTTIFLATDGDMGDAASSLRNIHRRGFETVFNSTIHKDMAGLKKDADYWPKVIKALQFNACDIILIDDDSSNLENARKNGVKTVDSRLPMDEQLKQLDQHYKAIKHDLANRLT